MTSANIIEYTYPLSTRYLASIQIYQKIQNLLFQKICSYVVMITLYQLYLFIYDRILKECFCVFYVNKCIFQASYKENRALNLPNHINWLQFSDTKICILLLPHILFNMLLNTIDNCLNKKARQKRNVLITQIFNQYLKITKRIIRDNSLNSKVLRSIKDSRSCSHAPSPKYNVFHSVSLSHFADQ